MATRRSVRNQTSQKDSAGRNRKKKKFDFLDDDDDDDCGSSSDKANADVPKTDETDIDRRQTAKSRKRVSTGPSSKDVKDLFATSQDVVVQELCYKIFGLEREIEGSRSKKPSTIKNPEEERLKNEIQERDLRLESRRKENDQLLENERALKKKVSVLEEQQSSAKEVLYSMEASKRKLMADNSQLRMLSERLAKTNEHLEKDVQEGKNVTSEITAVVENIRIVYLELRPENEGLSTDTIQALTPNGLCNLVTDFIKEANAAKKTADKNIKELKMDVNSMKMFVKNKKVILKEKDTQAVKHTIMVKSLEAEMDRVKGQLSAKITAADNLNSANAVLQKQLSEIDMNAKVKLRQQVGILEAALAKYKSSDQSQRQRLQGLEQTVTNKTAMTKQLLGKLETKLLQAKVDFQGRQTEINVLQKMKVDQSKGIELLNSRNAELAKVNRELAEEVRKWQIEAAISKTALQEQKVKINPTSIQVHLINAAIDDTPAIKEEPLGYC
jgi:chromosome segregation ATPase